MLLTQLFVEKTETKEREEAPYFSILRVLHLHTFYLKNYLSSFIFQPELLIVQST